MKASFLLSNVFLRWFKFEKVVEARVAKKTYHMDLDKLITVAKQECDIDDKDELSTMLNFYHDLGVIVKHGRTVVLQAQWLIDLFKQLITVRPEQDEVVNNDINDRLCVRSRSHCNCIKHLTDTTVFDSLSKRIYLMMIIIIKTIYNYNKNLPRILFN